MILLRFGVGTSNHSAIFIDVVLEQPIPHLVSRHEVNLKNSVDQELVREDIKGLRWNNIIRSPWPISILSEVLLRVICNRVPVLRVCGQEGDKPWFGD